MAADANGRPSSADEVDPRPSYRSRLRHLRVGLPTQPPAQGSTHPGEAERTGSTPPVDLGPYVAWLADRVDDETVRRRWRLVAQAYLEWVWSDGGRVTTRRSRFVPSAAKRLQLAQIDVEYALERFAEYRAVVARTIPVDG